MGCCKCEKFKWPDPQPVVWKDEEGDGKEYCVFHAPEEHKGISIEDFNKLVWERIDDFKSRGDNGKTCILVGSIFPEAISFTTYDKTNPLPAISFNKVTFGDGARFYGAMFGEGADFGNATFGDKAVFGGATFGERADFFRATFGDEADFFRATFGDEAVFGGATFGDRAVFAEATFGERADFFRATFSDKADFGEATFGDRAYFREATFGDEADFLWATFGERAGFEEATFGDGARFLGATFGDWARFLRATFGSRLSFAEATIGPRSSFNSTRFKGSSTFNQAKIQEGVTFSNNTFPDQTDFDRACIGDNVRFSEVTFDNISSFSEAEFGKQVIFSKCDFKQPALFRNPLSITDLRFQDMTAEQFKNADFIHCPLKDVTFTNIEWPRHYKEDRYHLPIEDNDNINKKAVADFYRQMKKRSIDEQNQAEASFWHFAEKEAFRKHLKASKDKLLLRFYTGTYRFISHYGESPTRALVVLAGLLALLAVVVALGGFAIHGIKPPAFYSERLGKFFLTFGQYALLTTPTYTLPPGYAAIALVISRLFIPIQAAIFGFALRNKLRR